MISNDVLGFTPVTVQIAASWDVMLCLMVEVCGHLVGKNSLHHQARVEETTIP